MESIHVPVTHPRYLLHATLRNSFLRQEHMLAISNVIAFADYCVILTKAFSAASPHTPNLQLLELLTDRIATTSLSVPNLVEIAKYSKNDEIATSCFVSHGSLILFRNFPCV